MHEQFIVGIRLANERCTQIAISIGDERQYFKTTPGEILDTTFDVKHDGDRIWIKIVADGPYTLEDIRLHGCSISLGKLDNIFYPGMGGTTWHNLEYVSKHGELVVTVRLPIISNYRGIVFD